MLYILTLSLLCKSYGNASIIITIIHSGIGTNP